MNWLAKIKTKIKIFIKRNYLFFIFQFVVILIIFILLNQNFLINTNIFFRKKFNDILFKSNEKINDNIIIVKIDEKFFSKEKISLQWLHRWFYAKTIENLHQKKVAAIGIDVLFENKYRFPQEDKFGKILNKIFTYYDQKLSQALTNIDILGAIYLPKKNKFILPDKTFLKNWSHIWHVTAATFPEFNWLTLWIYKPWVLKEEWKTIYPLGIETFKTAYHIPFIYSWNFIRYKLWNNILKIPISTYLWKKFIFLPIYADTDWNYKIKNISIYDVINKTKNFENINRNDKIVLIGATDPAINDYKLSYNWLIPWVIFHYNLINSLLNQDFIYILPEFDEKKIVFILILLNFIVITIIHLYSQKKKRENNYDLVFYYSVWITITTLIITGIFSFSSKNFFWYYIFLPVWSILSTNSLFLLANLGYSLVFSRKLQKLFDNLVNTYIGEHVKNLKVNFENVNKRIAKKWEVSIFFSDIAWFTNLSEKLSADETIKLINIYLEEMSLSIKNNHWIIDKYIGDAIMAFWDEKYTDNAVIASIENIKLLKRVNEKIKKYLQKDIKLNIRIWLHKWIVTMWDVWSSMTRFNFTIIWDNVNLASRLEGINKFYHTNICVSEEIIKNLKNPENFIFRKLDKIKVKGKDKPITIYQIFPKFSNELTNIEKQQITKLISNFEKALNLYFIWKFRESLKLFEQIYQIFNDQTSKVFVERCENLLKNPPQKWEGIRKFNKK